MLHLIIEVLLRLGGLLLILYAIWGTIAQMAGVYQAWSRGIMAVQGGGTIQWHNVSWTAVVALATDYLMGLLVMSIARPASRLVVWRRA